MYVGGYGGLLWRTDSVSTPDCKLAHQLGQQFLPYVYDQCQHTRHGITTAIILTVAGLAGLAISLIPAKHQLLQLRARSAGRLPPDGWMRIPAGWRPADKRFMPVPPGWPQPSPEWIPPAEWTPHPTWPSPPPGWPRPDRPSRAQVLRIRTATNGVSLIGLVLFGLEITFPAQGVGFPSFFLLVLVLVTAKIINDIWLFIRLRLMLPRPDITALSVAGWAFIYATFGGAHWARLTAFGLAIIATLLLVSLRSQRVWLATKFPKVPRPQHVVANPLTTDLISGE